MANYKSLSLLTNLRIGLPASRSQAGYNYKARFYDPQLSRFISADTVTPGGPQGLNRYSYSNNNPLNYNDPTGHYGEAVHTDLTYSMTFNLAMIYALRSGAGFAVSFSFSKDLASQVSKVDQHVDDASNVSDWSFFPPPNKNEENTPHWWTTEDAGKKLESATTTAEFGRDLHGFQDSFSHWQKLGMSNDPRDIYNNHAKLNQYSPKVCQEADCTYKYNDEYHPEGNPIHPDWTFIDQNMARMMGSYVQELVKKQWEAQYEN